MNESKIPNEHEIREYFNPNWGFKLYSKKAVAYPPSASVSPIKHLFLRFQSYFVKAFTYPGVVIMIPILIWSSGAITAALLGVFALFSTNLLAYSGPFGIGLGLAAYGWYVIAFPRILENLYPALGVELKPFGDIIKNRAETLVNRPWYVIAVGIVIAITNFADLKTFWETPSLNWPGTPWVQSNQSFFFALYYGFYSVLVAGILTGSGAVLILASVLIIYDLLKSRPSRLRLAYYRQLRSIGDLSIGLALWTFILFAETLIASVIFKPEALVTSSIIQSTLVSVALLTGLFAPVLVVRQAIIDAKFQQLISLGEVQYGNYQMIEQIKKKISSNRKTSPTGAKNHYENTLVFRAFSGFIGGILRLLRISSRNKPNPVLESDREFDQLRKYIEQVETTKRLIQEVEAIPNSPISVGSALQLIVAAATPILGLLANLLLSNKTP